MTLTSPTRGHLGHVNTGDVNLRLLVKVMSARTFHYKVTVNVFSFMFVCAQWCLILCDPKDSSSPGPTVHGILQARILEWVAISSSRGSS